MSEANPATGLEQELKQALDGLQDALGHASDAVASIRSLAPRVRSLNEIFDQIETAVAEGRRQIAGASAAISEGETASSFGRPTLVVPSASATPAAAKAWEPASPATSSWAIESSEPSTLLDASQRSAQPSFASGSSELVSFRLEFESRPGPLDLRAVDDAISEHPSVRDIALLDYDGHRATLKVWIEATASPSGIQDAIRTKVQSIFSSENDVTVVALEDAA